MHRIGTKAGRGLLGAVLAGLLATPLHAGSVTRLGDDHVNVKADRVPLGQLLRELAEVTPISTLVIEPKIEKQTVSAYVEGASVPEAIRKTLEESGVQFLLWGGGAEPLGLYVGDLRKAGLPPPSTAASAAGLGREERRAAREQLRAEKAEAAPEPPSDDALPPDSFGASANVDIGGGAPGSGTSPAGGNGGAIAPAAPIEGLPAPVRGTASWVGADGQTHSTGYTIQGDTVLYDDPNFVSFKNSPEARARRMNMDVTTLP
jgi:hypothetical protein